MVNFGVTRVSLHLINFGAICSIFTLCARVGETRLNTGADGNVSNEISFFRARQGSSESQVCLSKERNSLFRGTDYGKK